MHPDIDIDHLRNWIGRQERYSDTLTPALLQRCRATLEGYSELCTEIPLGIHWCLALHCAARGQLGVDGHPRTGDFLPPVPLSQRMWASSRIEFDRPLRLATPIERSSTVADIVVKHSVSSGPLVFVVIDHSYTQDRESVIRERQTLVYRQPTSYKKSAPQTGTETAREVLHSVQIVPDSTLLFRYSALTFNGHRIHYDYNYATQEEGYPGLVVHGPLTATLLMNLAQASKPDQALRTFEFRGAAPAFVDQALQLTLDDNSAVHCEEISTLEARNQQGGLIMSAQASW